MRCFASSTRGNRSCLKSTASEDQYLLTTQFYFAGDPALEGEGLTQGDNVHMLMSVVNGVDEAGNPTLHGERDVILSVNLPDYYPDINVQPGENTAVSSTISPVPNSKINLNDMTSEELLNTIPDFSQRMVREFFEYQSYISIQQFRREIGKYVDEAQVTEYEQ